MLISLAIRIVYIRDRTAELIDYLSNGLPAAGIGATTRAAKGFLECRIKTRSAMQLLVDTPTIVAPRHRRTNVGVSLRLGDIDIKSWFEEGRENDLDKKMTEEILFDEKNLSRSPRQLSEKTKVLEKSDWWRCLSMNITGMGRNIFISDQVDLHLFLRKPSWYNKTIVVRGRLTYVEAVITYKQWAIFSSVLSDNIGKDVDETSWDNVDKKAAEEDAKKQVEENGGEKLKIAKTKQRVSKTEEAKGSPLEYVEGAQKIHYGNKQSTIVENKSNMMTETDIKPTFEFDFELGGLSLTLHRNDPITPPSQTENKKLSENDFSVSNNAVNYDFARLRVQNVSIGLSSYSFGDGSAYIKLYGVDLCDLGDEGRNVRELLSKPRINLEEEEYVPRQPSAFSILCEGYASTENNEDLTESPQIVFTFDLSPNNSPVARIVLDYLSVYALVRPFIEILEFLSCAWVEPEIVNSANFDEKSYASVPKRIRSDASLATRKNRFWKLVDDESNSALDECTENGFQVKLVLVAHYPRVFFLACVGSQRVSNE